MEQAAIPPDEAERLARLREFGVLDTPAEEDYDDIVRVASYVMQTPVALISLVDEDRQWFKARRGLEATETPREISFCGHAVYARRTLHVEDATADPRFADNPLVTGPPHVRFYVGAPLRTEDGLVAGTLCAIDRRPRQATEEQQRMLEILAAQVMRLLEERRRTAAAQRMAAELRELSSMQRRFFEQSLDMLCVVGFDGYFKRVNPAWTLTLGHAEPQLLASPVLDLVHPDDREATAEEAARLAAGDHETRSFENRFRTADGEYRWLLWSFSSDRQSKLIIAVARDITPFKIAEERLEEARAAAEAASQAKSDFLAKMSHELRTPSNAVIGFTNLLRKNRSGAFGERERDYLDRIAANGARLLRLIDDVLDLTSIEMGRIELAPEPCDVDEVLRAVVGQLDGHAQATGTQLRLVSVPGVSPIPTDRSRLEQIVINLVGNALKFAAGGHVEVRLHADAQGRPLRIDVSDDGVGIPPDKLERIFESFRQADESTRRRFGGSGLGLAIARSLCEMLDLRLEVVSEPGRGSRFAVSLAEHDLPLTLDPIAIAP